ncbi:hypothetical protein EYF80_030508 [Liparis tanakae]|uniref:Uncharacterized protein n=1 Tax=Liparis tanakae TaxID=230148 RepID=A0A4Z2H1J9_9TELE|nr:hypothetical protein EYF80_030508 [Liparis tanakae]
MSTARCSTLALQVSSAEGQRRPCVWSSLKMSGNSNSVGEFHLAQRAAESSDYSRVSWGDLIRVVRLAKRKCHLSGDHVVPNEDEVHVLVSSDAQRVLDAPQVRCDVWQGGRLCPAEEPGHQALGGLDGPHDVGGTHTEHGGGKQTSYEAQHLLDLRGAEAGAEERALLHVSPPERLAQLVQLLHAQRGQLTGERAALSQQRAVFYGGRGPRATEEIRHFIVDGEVGLVGAAASPEAAWSRSACFCDQSIKPKAADIEPKTPALVQRFLMAELRGKQRHCVGVEAATHVEVSNKPTVDCTGGARSFCRTSFCYLLDELEPCDRPSWILAAQPPGSDDEQPLFVFVCAHPLHSVTGRSFLPECSGSVGEQLLGSSEGPRSYLTLKKSSSSPRLSQL